MLSKTDRSDVEVQRITENAWPIVAAVLAMALLVSWQCEDTTARGQVKEGSDEIAFTDVTEAAGLGGFRHVTGATGKYWMPETLGGGGGFIDYDGDGRLDILLVRGSGWSEEGASPMNAVALFRNMGDGTFADMTSAAGLEGVHAYAFGVTIADFDNDGDDDFYLTTLSKNLLFRNDAGTFVEIGEEAGVAGPEEWSSAAVFFDADGDGWVDLFVGNYVEWTPAADVPCSLAGGVRSYCTPDTYAGLPGRFYRNEGDGTFTERSAAAGFLAGVPGKTLAAAQVDFNNDGWMDLIVVNDTERDLLYRNNGDGTFEEIGVRSGIAYDRNGKARAGMGVDVGFVDSSGHPTIFVTNFAREQVGVYKYAGNDRFVERARQAQIALPSMNFLSFGVLVFDVDLDGHADVLTANGHINPEIDQVDVAVTYREPVRIYKNRGDGTFDVSSEGDVFDVRMVARGAAYGDYDGDGDLDVLLVENGGPVHLWRNDVSGRSYLRVHLEGTSSNRGGIGARAEAVVGSHRMIQTVRTGSSYLSSSERALTFGLGSHTAVDSLFIHWPSGTVDTLRGIEANQEIKVVEGSGIVPMDSEGREQAAAGQPQTI